MHIGACHHCQPLLLLLFSALALLDVYVKLIRSSFPSSLAPVNTGISRNFGQTVSDREPCGWDLLSGGMHRRVPRVPRQLLQVMGSQS